MVCTLLLTVSATNYIVCKEPGRSNYPSLYPCYRRNVTLFLCIFLHFCKLFLKISNKLLEQNDDQSWAEEPKNFSGLGGRSIEKNIFYRTSNRVFVMERWFEAERVLAQQISTWDMFILSESRMTRSSTPLSCKVVNFSDASVPTFHKRPRD